MFITYELKYAQIAGAGEGVKVLKISALQLACVCSSWLQGSHSVKCHIPGVFPDFH